MVHRPSFVDWQVPTPDAALPPMADEIMLVVYRGKVTLGVYHDTLEHGRIKRGWRIAVTPGARWEVVRNPPTAWASLPSYKPPQQPEPDKLPSQHFDTTSGSPCLRCSEPTILGWAVRNGSGYVFLNCIACGWNTETADPRKLPRVPNR